MNLILFFISTILCFSAVLIMNKLFKKEGLFVWMAIASIIANILVCKNINIGGIVFTLGNILFASNFLCTDIISEKYGSRYSNKSVYMSLCSVLIFILSTQMALLFIPDVSDVSQNAMKQLFAINLRTSIASVSMFFLSNLLDVYLFDKIKNKIKDKLWLRSGVSSILCNCIENFLFCLLAFYGIYDIEVVLSIALTTCIAELILSIIYIPFIYISKKFE